MTETIYNYKTVSAALEALKEKGYTIDFNMDDHFNDLANGLDNYTVDYLYRYEGPTDPADESTLYGISNANDHQKGVFLVGNLSFVEGTKRDIILALEMKTKQV